MECNTEGGNRVMETEAPCRINAQEQHLGRAEVKSSPHSQRERVGKIPGRHRPHHHVPPGPAPQGPCLEVVPPVLTNAHHLSTGMWHCAVKGSVGLLVSQTQNLLLCPGWEEVQKVSILERAMRPLGLFRGCQLGIHHS